MELSMIKSKNKIIRKENKKNKRNNLKMNKLIRKN